MMSELKATPGPWKACSSIEGDFFAVYPDTGKSEFPIAKKPDYIREDVWRANAHLIASSPRLYELLARALPFMVDYEDRCCRKTLRLTAEIERALSQARGETQP